MARLSTLLLLLFCLVGLVGCGSGSNPASQPVQNSMPEITSVSPSVLLVGTADVTLTVSGSGFVAGSTAQRNGSPLATTFISAALLRAQVPAADLTNAGPANISVVSPAPGGGTSAQIALSVNNPVPAIAQIAPGTVVAGSVPVTLNVKGSGFVASSVISWNGTALPTTVVSASELTAVLAANAIAGSSANSVTVSNPGPGGGSAPAVTYNVTSPQPAVTAVSPRVLPIGAAVTVTLTGSGFESNSTVLWNGAPRPTVFVNAGTLQAMLTAADLAAAGSGSLSVSNPGPGAAVSMTATVPISSQSLPTITGVTVTKSPGPSNVCSQLSFTLTGTNFAYGATVQVNGTTLSGGVYRQDTQTLFGYLPPSFYSRPGGLSFTVTSLGQSALVSNPFALPASAPTVLALCPSPDPATVYPQSSFTIGVTLSAVNATGAEQVAIGTLPAGLTTTTPSVPITGSGASLHFTTSAAAAPGTYQIALSTGSGQQIDTEILPLTISAGAVPAFSFATPIFREVGVPFGGSGSIQFNTIVNSNNGSVFDITPSVTGLPPKTTASFSPAVFSPGQGVTVTITATSDAPLAQNVTVTLVGTPSAQVATASGNFLVDVTAPPGSLADSRTDFVSLAGTPYAAVYDQAHDLIFASNPDWNRVDVLSNTSHKVIKHIPLRSPRGIDLTQDGALVWVQSASRSLYAISTATLQSTTFSLPDTTFRSSGADTKAGSGLDRVWALSDGSLFLYYDDFDSGGSARVGVWNPQTNALNVLSGNPTSAWSLPVRSGDGARVFAANDTYSSGVELYDVASKTLSVLNAGTNYLPIVAVNHPGTRLVLTESQGLGLYDASISRLGTVPGVLGGFGIGSPLDGGALFSPDGSTLYTVGTYQGQAVIVTTDANTLQVLGTAPALFTDPVGTSGYSGLTTPFALNPSGLVLGLQDYGIGFEDSTFFQTYASGLPRGNGEGEYISTYAGPLTGGPVSIFNQYGPLIPDIWFGQTRGTTTPGVNELSFIAPPSATPGPVNVNLIFPDGTQQFYPQFYSYGTNPQYAVLSGSGPQGGASGTVLGYGLPQDASGSSVTVGGNAATITTTTGQYPPLSGEPYPSTLLNFTFPAARPGLADLTVSSPIGSGTLPKSILYANEVTDYASSDTFNEILLDRRRNQLYLSSGDHIDVFSLASRQFVTPLHPPANGSSSNFTGMALTPDGSELLAANLLDGTLAEINPDEPASSSVIAIAKPVVTSTTCTSGPLYVSATSAHQAFVTTGGLPGPGCPSEGTLYVANLQSRTATAANLYPACTDGGFTDGFSTEATADGNTVVIGGSTYSSACMYSVASSGFSPVRLPIGTVSNYAGIAISADGNVLGSNRALADVGSDSFLGAVSQPVPFYGSNPSLNPSTALLHPKLNDSGSLYYFAFPNSFEIVDVQKALLRTRFSLTEIVQTTPLPMAIDAGGRFVYLITDKGLTLVDLGSAPLSIGHLSQSSASVSSTITIRGSGFDSGTAATVGNVAAVVSVFDENTLSLTVPSLNPGTYDLTLTRSDGGTYTQSSGLKIF